MSNNLYIAYVSYRQANATYKERWQQFEKTIMLKTKNIFLDAEIFVGSGYFHNAKLIELAKHGGNEDVTLYLTEITVNEIRSNIKEDINTVIHQVNEFKKKVHRNGRVLKNIEGFKEYIELPKINSKTDFNKINQALNDFIENGKVKLIPYQGIELKNIIDKYFNREKPFGEGKKKYEFPDAIIIESIEKWCSDNNEKIYVVSGDLDLSDYTSSNIYAINKVSTILNLINREINVNQAKLEWIDKIYNENLGLIELEIEKKFSEKFIDEISFELDVSEVQVDSFRFFDYSIIRQDEGDIILQMDVDIDFSCSISYTKRSWEDFERKHANINKSTTITVELEFEAYFEDKEGNQDISIHCIYTSIPSEEDVEDWIDRLDYD